jgi:hypothetical protein
MGLEIKPPSQAILATICEEFRHDRKTGELFRRVGTPTLDKYGDIRFVVNTAGRKSLVAHVIWFLEYGRWPASLIDHADGDSANNCVKNLRETTHGRNLANSRRNRRTLPVGVYAKRGKFQARIATKSAFRTLGTFDTPKEAEQVFIAEHLRRFGRHSRYFNGPRKQRFGS